MCSQPVKQHFHIRLILKGQELLGSQQWADGGWLNVPLIPFGWFQFQSVPPSCLIITPTDFRISSNPNSV